MSAGAEGPRTTRSDEAKGMVTVTCEKGSDRSDEVGATNWVSEGSRGLVDMADSDERFAMTEV